MTHAKIHPTAIIDPRATLADNVSVGPYTIIQGPVDIARATVIHAHCILKGPTRIGADCEIGPRPMLAATPSIFTTTAAWKPGSSSATGNVIRESASLHRATGPASKTPPRRHRASSWPARTSSRLGLGENVICANGALIAGHVTIGDRAFLSGGVGIHQFVRVGRLAIIGGNEITTADIPPSPPPATAVSKATTPSAQARRHPQALALCHSQGLPLLSQQPHPSCVIRAIKETCPTSPKSGDSRLRRLHQAGHSPQRALFEIAGEKDGNGDD